MKVMRAIADESVLVLGLASALCVALGASEAWTRVVAIAVPLALAILVRSITTSPSTLTSAVVSTAETLSQGTVGTVGTITASGEKTVDTVLTKVGGLAGKLAPRLGDE